MERVNIHDARVTAGVVEILQGADWLPAPDAVLMSEGAADSAGKAVIGENFAVYIVDTQPDLQHLIDLVTDLTDAVLGMTNTLVSKTPDQVPFDPAANVVIQLIKTELEGLELT